MSKLGNQKNYVYLQSVRQGLMAERLGTALQKLLQRFESASDLTKNALQLSVRRFYFEFVRHLYGVMFDGVKNRKDNFRDHII